MMVVAFIQVVVVVGVDHKSIPIGLLAVGRIVFSLTGAVGGVNGGTIKELQLHRRSSRRRRRRRR